MVSFSSQFELRSLSALVMTETELKVIALAIIGLSNSPMIG